MDNIFVCDINQEALDSYKESLGKLALEYFSIKLSDEYFKEHIGRGLLFDVTKETFEYTPLEDVFKFKSGDSKFDIVVTNHTTVLHGTMKEKNIQFGDVAIE